MARRSSPSGGNLPELAGLGERITTRSEIHAFLSLQSRKFVPKFLVN
jgi:hypothetical protein